MLILIVALSWLGSLALIIALRVRATKPWRRSLPTQNAAPRTFIASARLQLPQRRAAPSASTATLSRR
ncbi:MAG TPA: hypothetical protein VGH21_06470 [Solirubrobacteraceae bacterium]